MDLGVSQKVRDWAFLSACGKNPYSEGDHPSAVMSGCAELFQPK